MGITTISLNASSNESGADRTATVTFSLGDDATSVFTITQAELTTYIEIDPISYEIDADGESFTINVDTNLSTWNIEMEESATWLTILTQGTSYVTFTAEENADGKTRTADVIFYSDAAPEVMAYLELSQGIPVDPPTADLLDVIFNSDGSAYDASEMGMTIDNSRLDSYCSVAYNSKYGCYAAQFNNSTIGRSDLNEGYYMVPYTTDSDFATSLEDGFTYELVFCTYYEPTTTQTKPFASTQAGGTGMCMRASTGEINYEIRVNGSWVELYSDVLPQKGNYYHVVATWDKTNGIALLYVDGTLTASKNTSGDFNFMTTNVDSCWFGIGADPDANDRGEASFYGEIVIARLYDDPISAAEVKALYKLVK